MNERQFRETLIKEIKVEYDTTEQVKVKNLLNYSKAGGDKKDDIDKIINVLLTEKGLNTPEKIKTYVVNKFHLIVNLFGEKK